eukprot:jgi/Psemu1/56613/gm1.56613_g
MFYKELKRGTRIQPGHIFTVQSDAPTAMKIWQDSPGTADDVSVQDLQNRITTALDRDRVLREAIQFIDIICPYQGDGVMRKFKEERNRKHASKLRGNEIAV